MKVMFMGTPEISAGCLEALVSYGHEVVCVIMAAQEAAHMPIEPFCVRLYDGVECLVVFARSLQCYDFLVIHAYLDYLWAVWFKQKQKI